MAKNCKRIAICLSLIDFDALAGLVCVTMLYPGTVALKHDAIEEQVTRYLGIAGGVIRFQDAESIDHSVVEEVIIVDTRPTEKIDEFLSSFPNVKKVIIIDHHDLGDYRLAGKRLYSKTIGSTTSMLVPLLRKKHIYISPQQASLFLTAIYEDTASLIAPTTKPADLNVASYLMSIGGNLQTVRRFINSSLSERGKDILGIFLDSIEVIPMGGILVAIATARYDKYVENLAFITHKLFDLVEADAIFTASSFAGKTYFVGRSLDERLVDCSKVMAHFGGGGHRTASAAKIAGELSPQVAFSRLASICRREVTPPPTVATIMNYPVKSIDPAESVNIAGEKLRRFGHGGLPVVNRGKLIGIVTRRDLDKVPPYMEEKPVKRFMTPNPLTTAVDSSIVEARRLMMRNGVGRLPVIDEGNLVGIITRSDVMSADFWHRGQDIGPYPLPTKLSRDQTRELYSRMPKRMLTILEHITGIANGLGISAYLVGGAVRDMLLSRIPYDLDILVEGDAINLAHALSRILEGHIIQHERFGTAQISIPGLKIDLASSRAEYYKEPGSHPSVVASSIFEDLKRRDFTINALALALTGPDARNIIDVCGGLDDIANKKIRILHNLSFIEDPTRILRAVYYTELLDFVLEKKTNRYAKEAIRTGLLSSAKNDRTAQELLRILSHENGIRMLVKLRELNGISAIFGRRPMRLVPLLKRIDRLREYADELELKTDIAKLRILALMKSTDGKQSLDVLKRLKLPGNFIEHIHSSATGAESFRKTIAEGDNVKIWREMKGKSNEAIVFSCLTSRLNSSLKLLGRLARIGGMKLEINGDDLINMGMSRGKAIGSVLDIVLAEKVAGRVHGRIEELTMARRLVK